jgi:thiol-disulfide isomerase/thioredoxin
MELQLAVSKDGGGAYTQLRCEVHDGKFGLQVTSKGNMMRWRWPHGILFLAFLSAPAVAEPREAAPQFTASTLQGETFTNASLRGHVALLQFWTTWCPYCRREQPILENITSDFSGQGLVVLAVNVGESRDTVEKYLEEHARKCRIVLTKDTNLVAEFHPTSFPFYVLIDREGNIAGTEEGAGGDLGIRDLLSRAGLGGSLKTSHNSDQRPSLRTPYTSTPRLLEVPKGQGTPPPKSLPPTVFVLSNGERLEAHHYTIIASSLHITAQGYERTIPLATLDLKATLTENHERGIDLKLPSHPGEISLGF